MTQAEHDDLVDLYVDNTLPEALRAVLEAHFASHPNDATDAAALLETVNRLKAVPTERPDTWFAERTLDRLLREHAAAQDTETILSRR